MMVRNTLKKLDLISLIPKRTLDLLPVAIWFGYRMGDQIFIITSFSVLYKAH
jgi:hypothetical protein